MPRRRGPPGRACVRSRRWLRRPLHRRRMLPRSPQRRPSSFRRRCHFSWMWRRGRLHRAPAGRHREHGAARHRHAAAGRQQKQRCDHHRQHAARCAGDHPVVHSPRHAGVDPKPQSLRQDQHGLCLRRVRFLQADDEVQPRLEHRQLCGGELLGAGQHREHAGWHRHRGQLPAVSGLSQRSVLLCRSQLAIDRHCAVYRFIHRRRVAAGSSSAHTDHLDSRPRCVSP